MWTTSSAGHPTEHRWILIGQQKTLVSLKLKDLYHVKDSLE